MLFVNKHRLFELYESDLRKQAWANENRINLILTTLVFVNIFKIF